MKRLIFILINILGILLVSGCAYGIRYEGPYSGRIIDADTRKPIEGVVVLGVWYREIVTPGGATHNYYDAKETVTDKNGDFTIAGQGLLILSNVIPVDVLIFKAGYEYLKSPWESLKRSEYLIKKMKIKWEGNKVTIPLKELTMEGRKRRGTPSRPNIPITIMELMTQEINKERLAQGLKPFPNERQ
jgi:hypothetical protein